MVNRWSSTRNSIFCWLWMVIWCDPIIHVLQKKNWRMKHFPSSWLGIMAGYDTFHRSTYANDLHMYNIYIMIWYSPLHVYIYNTMYSNILYIYILAIYSTNYSAQLITARAPPQVVLLWIIQSWWGLISWWGKLVIQWVQLCHYIGVTIVMSVLVKQYVPNRIFTIWGEKNRDNGDFWGWCIEKTGLGT